MFQRDSISQLVASGLYNRLKCFQWTINAKSAIPDLQPLKSLYIQLQFQLKPEIAVEYKWGLRSLHTNISVLDQHRFYKDTVVNWAISIAIFAWRVT